MGPAAGTGGSCARGESDPLGLMQQSMLQLATWVDARFVLLPRSVIQKMPEPAYLAEARSWAPAGTVEVVPSDRLLNAGLIVVIIFGNRRTRRAATV